jgi:hypothetical protein
VPVTHLDQVVFDAEHADRGRPLVEPAAIERDHRVAALE